MNVNADIIPNDSLGGIKLRTPIKALLYQLGTDFLHINYSYEMPNPFLAIYTTRDGISIYVDLLAGKVQAIHSGPNYKQDFKSIKVGMRVSEAYKILPDLYYDEVESVIVCKGIEGIEFDLPYEDPEPKDVPNLSINNIVVFATESREDGGYTGNW